MSTTGYYPSAHTQGTRYFEFVRLPTFERTAAGILGEEEVRALEAELVRDPRSGVVIVGTGGVRKIRVAVRGRGKSGSARVLYLSVEAKEKIYLLMAFAKNAQDDLSPEQRKGVEKLAEALRWEL